MFPFGPDPFGLMMQQMQHMERVMNQSLLGPQEVPPQQHAQHPQTAPTVEELPHDRHAARSGAPGALTGAIVEEPDDDEDDQHPPQQHPPQQQRYHPYVQQQQQQQAPAPPQWPFGPPMMVPPFQAPPDPFGPLFGGLMGGMMMGGGGLLGGGMLPGPGAVAAPPQAGGLQRGQVYSYSSSSVVRTGPDGTYSSTTTSRHAPGGVREMQRTVRDGLTGTEAMTLARGLGQQERVVHKTRDATGRMVTEERHTGVDPAGGEDFDREWVARAQQNMPGWMRQQQPRDGAGGGQSLALPPAGGGSRASGWQQQQQQQAQYAPPYGHRGSSGARPGGYHV